MSFAAAIRAICDAQVVLIGGLAADLHGSATTTYDVDICFSQHPANLLRLVTALTAFHPRPRGFPDDQTLRNISILTLQTDIGSIEILTQVAGIGAYPAVKQCSHPVQAFDRTFATLDLPALIESKRATGRPKDLAAIPELQALQTAVKTKSISRSLWRSSLLKLLALYATLCTASAIPQIQAQIQAQEKPAPELGTLTGAVTESIGAKPIPDAKVSIVVLPRDADGKTVVTRPEKIFETTTDSSGAFTLTSLPVGDQTVFVTTPSPDTRSQSKKVRITSAKEPTKVAMDFVANGTINGTVIDDDHNPIEGIAVILIAQEYSGGSLQAVLQNRVISSAGGAFVLHGLKPDRLYRLLAIRTFPLDPETLARADHTPFLGATWFPGSLSVDGSAAFSVTAGSVRYGLEIRMKKVEGRCIDAKVDASSTNATTVSVMIEQRQFTTGFLSAFKPKYKEVAVGERFQLCGLQSGPYRLSAITPSPELAYGRLDFDVGREDIQGLNVTAFPLETIPVVMRWATEDPPPAAAKVHLRILPTTRISLQAESPFLTAEIPSRNNMTFTRDSFFVEANSLSDQVYIKSVLYNNKEVNHGTISINSALDGPLEIIASPAAGSTAITVTDSNARGVADVHVILTPANLDSPAAIADNLRTGLTDLTGTWTASRLPPGKYIAMVFPKEVTPSPECLAELLSARSNSGVTVEVHANQRATATLKPPQ